MNNTRSILSETTGDVERSPSPGQIATVLTGLAIGILLMGIQLWLLTIALDLYLGGQDTYIWLLAVISGLVFLGGLLVLRVLTRRPRSQTRPRR
ncbi:MAG: hypothetical protein E6I93_05060 [Chloroflexi bacterium]|nr:MAG: hypothetical protein E6I93_05060 [Chloroflexota bacterium]